MAGRGLGRAGGARALDALGAAFVLLSVAVVLRDPLRIHHDSANLLASSLQWVEGRASFADVAGMNLPLAIYVYAVPAWVAGASGLAPAAAFSLVALSLLVASVAACRGLLGRRAPGGETGRAAVSAGLAGLLLLSLEGPELTFGQREVFFLGLWLPFLLVRWRRAEGRPPGIGVSFAAGAAAAIGALLKPQYLLCAALAEGGLRLGRRPFPLLRCPECAGFAVAALAYVSHVLLLPGPVLAAFGEAVSGAASGYRAYDATWAGLLLRPSFAFAVLVALAGLLAARSEAAPFSSLAGALSGLAAGGLLAYAAQRKGFSYHLVPAVAGAVLACVAVAASSALAGIRRSLSALLAPLARPARVLAPVLPAVAAVAVARAAAGLPAAVVPVPGTPLEDLLCEVAPARGEVLAISTSVLPVYPALVRMDRRPYGRWVGPFMGIAFARAGDPREGAPRYPALAQTSPAERAVLEALARDLRAAPVRYVLVAAEPPHQGLPARFDLVEYLRAAGFLESALGDYGRRPDRAGFAVYRLRSAAAIDAATHSSIGGVNPG